MASIQSEERQRALNLLADGYTVLETAGELGIRRSTIWKWTQEPSFANELEKRRFERRNAVRETLHVAALDAVRVLWDVVQADHYPVEARVQAAAQLLDRAGVVQIEPESQGAVDPKVKAEARVAAKEVLETVALLAKRKVDSDR